MYSSLSFDKRLQIVQIFTLTYPPLESKYGTFPLPLKVPPCPASKLKHLLSDFHYHSLVPHVLEPHRMESCRLCLISFDRSWFPCHPTDIHSTQFDTKSKLYITNNSLCSLPPRNNFPFAKIPSSPSPCSCRAGLSPF